ncbi:hypothetical protein GIB67_039345 [Kingdonia uniflora]|uniref:Cytochrome P450 n=1 Tax=Kingdonia uniflora TaxID=39325 RepID=A0A7J7LX83_9MAGN|nr:hypothetical protein GIB67_039345 [Kingdonia uniflora]
MELLQGFLSTTFEFQLPFLVTVFVTLGAFYRGYAKFKTASLQGRNLPPGSLGFPVIGESIGFVSAMKKNNRREWVERRIRKYGPLFKTSLMGSHVVILTGQAGNKLIFSANDAIRSNQTMSTAAIFGKHSIFELEGSRHKLLRSVMMNYLKPDNLQKYVVQMNSIVKQQMLQELQGKDSVQFVPLIKKVTFDISCSILFGLPEGMEKDILFHDSDIAITGSWALPLDIPGTPFRKA